MSNEIDLEIEDVFDTYLKQLPVYTLMNRDKEEILIAYSREDVLEVMRQLTVDILKR